MKREYTPDDCLSCSELKSLPIGSTIVGEDTYYLAIKTGCDAWTFDDRIDQFFDTTSYFVANAFDGTTFHINIH